MNQLMRKALLQSLLCILGLLGTVQHVQAQSSPHDSLRRLLVYFKDSTQDEELKKAVTEAQNLYAGDRIDDSIATKLLTVEDLLINAPRPKLLMLLPYAQTLMVVLKEMPPQGENPAYAETLNKLAVLLYRDMGQYDKALPLFQQAVAIRKKALGEENVQYGESLNNLALLYKDMGQYDKALPLFQQAVAITKKILGEENLYYAISLSNLAILYQDMGQYEKALPLFQQDLAITKKQLGEQHLDYAISLNNLALLYQIVGQYEKALPLFQQAAAIRKKALGEEHPAYATGLNNLASIYRDMGQHEKALPLFQQAAAITKKALGEEHPAYAISLSNLAQFYRDMGQYDKVLPLFQQAAAIRKKALGEEHPAYAISLSNLAQFDQDMGQYEKALPLVQQSLSIRKKQLGEEHPEYANSLVNLATTYKSIGKTEDASALLIEAANLTLKHLSGTYTTLSEQEKMSFVQKNNLKFVQLPSLLMKSANQPALARQVYANELALKSMVLIDQKTVLNIIKKSSDSVALSLYEQWKLNKALMGKQLLLPLNKRVPYFDSLQEASNQLEQQLSRSSRVFQTQVQSQSLTAKDVAQKLNKGEAAIEFIRFPFYDKKVTDSVFYAALVLLPQDTVARFIPLFEEKQLDHLLKRSAKAGPVHAAVDRLYSFRSKALGDSLYQLVWQPLDHYLTGIQTIYYAPAGLLHQISFPALGTDSAHLLVDQYRLNQVLSTRSLVMPAEVTRKQMTASVWGNIQYTNAAAPAKNNTRNISRGENSVETMTTLSAFALYNEDVRGLRGQGWEPLSYAKAEMENVTKLFAKSNITVTTQSGLKATEEAFKAMDGNGPQVLLMATHGFFLPAKESMKRYNGSNNFSVQQNPMFRSGLVLAGGNRAWKGEPGVPGKEDGILTAYEIAQMDLSNTDLVVLSACETALGDLQGSEGVIGLQRAFKMAGVKQLIVSLWKVNDKATAELMTHFYKSWLGGQTTREALRYAQLKLKEKYPSPFYWAAFVLVE